MGTSPGGGVLGDTGIPCLFGPSCWTTPHLSCSRAASPATKVGATPQAFLAKDKEPDVPEGLWGPCWEILMDHANVQPLCPTQQVCPIRQMFWTHFLLRIQGSDFAGYPLLEVACSHLLAAFPLTTLVRLLVLSLC